MSSPNRVGVKAVRSAICSLAACASLLVVSCQEPVEEKKEPLELAVKLVDSQIEAEKVWLAVKSEGDVIRAITHSYRIASESAIAGELESYREVTAEDRVEIERKIEPRMEELRELNNRVHEHLMKVEGDALQMYLESNRIILEDFRDEQAAFDEYFGTK